MEREIIVYLFWGEFEGFLINWKERVEKNREGMRIEREV